MASLCLSTTTTTVVAVAALSSSSSSMNHHHHRHHHQPELKTIRSGFGGFLSNPNLLSSSRNHKKKNMQVVRMAPDEERMTRRSPLDFPMEWEPGRPGRRADIFPQFSPLKTPLPLPLPADPPEEDEEEEEENEEGEEGNEEDPDNSENQ